MRNLEGINVKLTIYVNLIGITMAPWNELLYANCEVIFGKKYSSEETLKVLEISKQEILTRMEWCEGRTFEPDFNSELPFLSLNDFALIQKEIDKAPTEAEKAELQQSFNQFKFLVIKLLLILEGNDKRVFVRKRPIGNSKEHNV